MDGWMDKRVDEWLDERMDGWIKAGWANGWMYG